VVQADVVSAAASAKIREARRTPDDRIGVAGVRLSGFFIEFMGFLLGRGLWVPSGTA
jgi:hypothetical protein